MAIYRDVAVNGMVGTIEDAMRQVLHCWAELSPEMQDAIDAFRTQLGAAIDSMYLVKRALDQEVHESEMRLGQTASESCIVTASSQVAELLGRAYSMPSHVAANADQKRNRSG